MYDTKYKLGTYIILFYYYSKIIDQNHRSSSRSANSNIFSKREPVKRFLVFVIIPPALENSLSLGTDVATY